MQHQPKRNRFLLPAVALVALVALTLMVLAPTEAAPAQEEAAAADWEVIADGLGNPRGLTFGPDGALYVAEAGSGGDGACVPDPEGGNRCFGNTGAITKVTFDAGMNPTNQEQVITGVGSLANEDSGTATGGPTAVAFYSGVFGDSFDLHSGPSFSLRGITSSPWISCPRHGRRRSGSAKTPQACVPPCSR